MNIQIDPSADHGAKHKNHRRARTGISGMDEILCGGLIAQRLYLIDGNPGAGKTTMALQFLLERIADQGHRHVHLPIDVEQHGLHVGLAPGEEQILGIGAPGGSGLRSCCR